MPLTALLGVLYGYHGLGLPKKEESLLRKYRTSLFRIQTFIEKLVCSFTKESTMVWSTYGSTCTEIIAELVDYLKIPVMSQTMPRGLFADEEKNPLFKLGAGAMPAADVVMMLCVNNDYRVGKARPPLFNKDAKLIQVHPDVTKIGYNAPAEVGIVGGAGPVAKQILEVLKAKTPKRISLGHKAQEMGKPPPMG